MVSVLALMGCQTQGVKLGDLKDKISGIGGDRTENLDAPFVEQIAEKYTPKEETPSVEKGQLEVRKVNLSQSDIPYLENYANEVLTRLVDAWPGEKPQVKVILVSDANYRAVTFIDNKIIALSIGTFRELMDSEDQLAALLAHELSHILAEHGTKNELDVLVSKASMASELYLGSQANATTDLSNQYAKTKIASWAAENLLFPTWNRAQENEADTLGIDLLVLAGYQPRAMTKVINSLEKTSQTRKSFIESQLEEESLVSNDPSRVSSPAAVIISNIGAQLKDQYGQEYDSYQVRKTQTIEYTRRFYKSEYRQRKYQKDRFGKVMLSDKVSSPLAKYFTVMDGERSLADGKLDDALSKGYKGLSGDQASDPYIRYVMYQIRLQQGDVEKAAINLTKAFESGRATLAMYHDFANYLLQGKRYGKALAVLLVADDLFEQPDILLPSIIKASKASGRNSSVYNLRCMMALNKGLWEQCSQASN